MAVFRVEKTKDFKPLQLQEGCSMKDRLQKAIQQSSRMGIPDPDKKPHHEKER